MASPRLLQVLSAHHGPTGSDGYDAATSHLRRQSYPRRFFLWLTRRPRALAGTWQARLLDLFNSLGFSIVVVALTIAALFLVDTMRIISTTNATDTIVGAIIMAAFLFFLAEMLGMILVQDGYFLSFFFACDFIGTFSLIFDIPWINNPAGLTFTGSSAAVLRASRIARTGARATRVLRLLRTVRMPALLNFCGSRHRDDALLDGDEDIEPTFDDAVTSQPRRPASPKPNSTGSSGDTNVATKLQLVVSKRVILLVVVMIFVTPLLSETVVDSSRDLGLNMVESTVMWNPTSFNRSVDTYLALTNHCIYVHVGLPTGTGGTDNEYARPADLPDTSEIRAVALANLTSNSGYTYALFDDSQRQRTISAFSIGMTLFTCLLFCGGSILFTQDAEQLFFKPIERMIQTIKRLANIMFEMDATGSAGGASIAGVDGGNGGPHALDDGALDETLLIEAVVARMADLFNVRLERDGVARKTTHLRTAHSRWRVHVEEEMLPAPPVTAKDLVATTVKNADLLLIHEIEELASLARCLESPTCTMYFTAYLREVYASEYVHCLAEIKAYRRAAERLAHQARAIYNLFVSDQALNQVDLEWTVRRAVSQTLKAQMAYLADVFLAVETAARQTLSRHFYPRFLHSIHCVRLLKHLTLERRRHQQHRTIAPGAYAHATVSSPESELPGGGRIQMADMEEIKRALHTM